MHALLGGHLVELKCMLKFAQDNSMALEFEQKALEKP